MTRTLVVRGSQVSGSTKVPGDKSISHRALLLAAAGRGRSLFRGIGPGEDVASTVRCLQGYGIPLAQGNGQVEVESKGMQGWSEPDSALDCGNSGTTMRVLSGLAARLEFRSVLDGDASLRRRPMDRVVEPLRTLGATVSARDGRFPPLDIRGGHLRGTTIAIGVPSAQVKSAVLLAGLGASGTTTVVEPSATRDHTERMLVALGVPLRRRLLEDGTARVEVEPFELASFSLDVPGDVSSAAFLVSAALLAGSVAVEDVGLNPTRTGFLDLVRRMGGSVSTKVETERMGEPVGLIRAVRIPLFGVAVGGAIVPSVIDELPLLAVLASQATGETAASGAGELRVKESDRIAAVEEGLRRLGASIRATPDGFVVSGPTPLRGTTVDAWGDHRIAMALAVAGLVADGETRVTGWEAAAVSWPGFEDVLAALGADISVEDE